MRFVLNEEHINKNVLTLNLILKCINLGRLYLVIIILKKGKLVKKLFCIWDYIPVGMGHSQTSTDV
jgi:hypothetical protein